MTAKQVIAAMTKGATLCMEFQADGTKVYWLHPRRQIVRVDVGEKISRLAGIVPGGDTLLNGGPYQTWKVA